MPHCFTVHLERCFALRTPISKVLPCLHQFFTELTNRQCNCLQSSYTQFHLNGAVNVNTRYAPGILLGVDCEYRTDVSGQPIGTIFKGHVILAAFDVVCAVLEPNAADLIIPYRRFGATYRSHIQGSSNLCFLGLLDA